MSVMLSALINALYETNTVSIVRRVYRANSAPKVGCLVPHIKTNYEVSLNVFIDCHNQSELFSIIQTEMFTKIATAHMAKTDQKSNVSLSC